MDLLHSGILAVSNFLYQPFIVPLLLICGGLYFTIRTGAVQLKLLKESVFVVMEKPATENGISSFGALMISTASRVGTGNIIGVATAVVLGGAGALFWMWVVAILGSATAFIESTLAQVYKKKRDDGTSYGGPAFYMRDALHARWLGIIFSVIIILTYAVGYNMLAAYNLQSTFAVFDFYHEGTTPAIIGVILAVLFAAIVIGGAKRLTKVTGFLVPIMGIIYVGVSIIVIIINIKNIPEMFSAIFKSAFDFEAIFGGFAGSCLMNGVKRGLYSNEAGMGSAPNAAATADVSHPVKQGLVQMLSVYLDTIIICTATGFMCLSSGIGLDGFVGADGSADAAGYVQTAMQESLGSFGPIFIAVAMSLFAFTTLIGNYGYCEGCFAFILNRNMKKSEYMTFRVIASVLVFVGAISQAGFVWDLADCLQASMVVLNVPTILLLGGTAFKCLKDYESQKKAGIKNPIFLAKNIDLKEETDYWN